VLSWFWDDRRRRRRLIGEVAAGVDSVGGGGESVKWERVWVVEERYLL